MGVPLRLLLIEDTEDHEYLLLRELRRNGFEPDCKRVETADEMAKMLAEHEWDVIISDYVLPQFSALHALEVLQETGLDLPFIVVSGRIGEDTAVSSMRAGAHDYIMKDNLARLVPAVERELREAKNRRDQRTADDERRLLERELVDVIQREQNRIGQDLHDGLGQHLLGTAFLSKTLAEKLESQSSELAAEAVEIARLTNEAILQTRIFARGLCPTRLADGKLNTVLGEFAGSIRDQFAIQCDFQSDKGDIEADQDTLLHVYRIAQEAVSNAIRHGGAGNIKVSLQSDGERFVLKIVDDGKGLPDGYEESVGMGLRIMNYRARMIDAVLVIAPEPGGGTSVTCTSN